MSGKSKSKGKADWAKVGDLIAFNPVEAAKLHHIQPDTAYLVIGEQPCGNDRCCCHLRDCSGYRILFPKATNRDDGTMCLGSSDGGGRPRYTIIARVVA
jgi:hypothetical protein